MKSDFYEELKDGIESFKDIITKYKNHENIEIELRIGQIQFDKFVSGLNNKEFFDKIRANLDSSTDFKKKVFKIEEKIKNGYRKIVKLNNTRVTKDIVKKERILNMEFKYNNTPYDIRLSVSTEKIVDNSAVRFTNYITRIKNRNSYYYKDFRIDLTEVEQIENSVSSIQYELEVELINLNSNMSDLYRAHSAFLLMYDFINMCEKIEKNSKIEKIEKELNKDLEKMNI
jgi:hypothetical protein